jgi:hypothetical protein
MAPLVQSKKLKATAEDQAKVTTATPAGAPVRRSVAADRGRDRVSVATLDERNLEIPTFLRKRNQS